MFMEICLSEKDLVKALLGVSVVCSLFLDWASLWVGKPTDKGGEF